MVVGFLVLWGTLVFFDRIVIGANYIYTVHDLEIGWFSWMLNWFTGEPRLVWYSPAVSPRILNGVVSSFIDIDFSEKPIISFVAIGILLQGIFVVICAIWYSWIADKLCLDIVVKVVLVVLFFSFPTLLMYAGHRGFYFEFWLFGLPLGLTLHAALSRVSQAYALAGAGCGFLVANYYPSAIVVIVFTFVIVGQRLLGKKSNWNGKSHAKSVVPQCRSEAYLALWLALCVTAWVIGSYYSQVDFGPESIRIPLLLSSGVFGWMICYYFALMVVRWEPRMSQYLLWMTGVFVISSTVLLPWYWQGLIELSKQGIDYKQSIATLLFRVIAYPWYGVIWFVILCLFGMFVFKILFKLKGKKHLDQMAPSLLFATIGMFGVMLFAGATEGSISGGPERGFIAGAPMFAAGIIVLTREANRYWRILIVGPILVVSGYAVYQFYVSYIPTIEEQQLEGDLLDEAIDAFLEKESDGSVVCVSEEYFSKYCTVAYAYNRYRTPRSADKLPSQELFDGRVLSLNARMPDRFGNWDDSNRVVYDLLFSRRGPFLVVTKGGWFRDNLIGLFEVEGYQVLPFYRWWKDYRSDRDKPVTNVSPGNMFIAERNYSM
jgi:hypothetical protein